MISRSQSRAAPVQGADQGIGLEQLRDLARVPRVGLRELDGAEACLDEFVADVGRVELRGDLHPDLLTRLEHQVEIERTDARAMLTGDGGDSPRLEFIRGSGSIKAGDRILSSGDGGGLPRGLPVGVAAKGVDGAWRVKLFSDHGAIDYVRVLLFQSFGQLVSPNALNAPPLAGLSVLLALELLKPIWRWAVHRNKAALAITSGKRAAH